MISKVRLFSDVMIAGNLPATLPAEFVADWELQERHCVTCDAVYGERLLVKEFRPLLPADSNLPTLLILPFGDLSPRGAFSFHQMFQVEDIPYRVAFHYYEKDHGSLFLLTEGGEIDVISTRRYTNPDLWPVLAPDEGGQTHSGAIGWAEECRSTVFLARGVKFLPLPEFIRSEGEHRRCRGDRLNKKVKVGCTEIVLDMAGDTPVIRVGKCWECHVLPAWVQMDHMDHAQFERVGALAPVSTEAIIGNYERILSALDSIGVRFYADGESVEELTGWVAFQFKEEE